MFSLENYDPVWLNWVIIPFLIFVSRVLDVSLNTLRIIFTSKGKRNIAPILGFFEVLIWLIAISQIMQNLNNWLCYFAWAFGFSMGNYLGLFIEEKLAIGNLMIQIIVPDQKNNIAEKLRESGFGATIFKAEGSRGDVIQIVSLFKRKDREVILNLINMNAPDAFYTISDVKNARNTIFSPRK